MQPTSSPASPPKTGSKKARASAARLAAAQAVYQSLSTGQAARSTIVEFLEYRLGAPVDGVEMVTPDRTLFSAIVSGVDDRRLDLDHLVKNALNDEDKDHESLLRAIMLCGAYELLAHGEIDAPIIISDYVHVTDAFFDVGEKKLVNAVLDRIAKNLRDS